MDSILIFFCVGIIGFLIILVYQSNQKISELESNQNKLKLEYNQKVSELESNKQNEIQSTKTTTMREASVAWEKWKQDNESKLKLEHNQKISELENNQNKLKLEYNQKVSELENNQNKLKLEYNQKVSELENNQNKLKLEYNQKVSELESNKQNEIQSTKTTTMREASVLWEKWKQDNESKLKVEYDQKVSELESNQNKLKLEYNQKISGIESNQNKLKLEAVDKLRQLESDKSKLILEAVDKFKQDETQSIKTQSMKEASVAFDKWKTEYELQMGKQREKDIEEAIKKSNKKSKEVIRGQVTEQLIPFFEDFPFNPKDVRFLGSPIDLIVFNGLSDEASDDVSIHFVEIKTGSSQLSRRQKLIKEAVGGGRVHWEVIRKTALLESCLNK